VVVLGRQTEVDIHELIRRAWRERRELVVLNLGFPLSRSQQETVDAVLEAGEAIEFEARICYDETQVDAAMRAGDEVVFASSAEERRMIDDAIGLRRERLGH
jgi:hypothetical protein